MIFPKRKIVAIDHTFCAQMDICACFQTLAIRGVAPRVMLLFLALPGQAPVMDVGKWNAYEFFAWHLKLPHSNGAVFTLRRDSKFVGLSNQNLDFP